MGKHTHPYESHEGGPLWNAVAQAVKALAKNGDLELTTDTKYVVGFLCKQLTEPGVVATPESTAQASTHPTTGKNRFAKAS